jgi:hypothetical protein
VPLPAAVTTTSHSSSADAAAGAAASSYIQQPYVSSTGSGVTTGVASNTV